MAKRKTDLDKVLDEIYEPVIEIDNKDMWARYFDDGSGEIALFDRGDSFFSKEDGGIKYQIEYINEHMTELKRQIAVCKRAATVLKKAKSKAKL